MRNVCGWGAVLLVWSSVTWLEVAIPISASGEDFMGIRLADSYQRLKGPETDRLAVQLTSGEGFTYPLYFFIPSITRDGKYLIYHRAADGEVQLHRLNFATGHSQQLTHARCPDTQWRPWCVDSGRGVLGANDEIRVGIVGLGGRGASAHVPGFQNQEGVKVVAIADVDQQRLGSAADMIQSKYGHRVEQTIASPPT